MSLFVIHQPAQRLVRREAFTTYGPFSKNKVRETKIMAATIEDYGDYSFMPVAKAAKQDGKTNSICASLFASFIGSREAWAKDLVAAHWATLPDSELAALGLSAQEIGNVRDNVRAQNANWR